MKAIVALSAMRKSTTEKMVSEAPKTLKLLKFSEVHQELRKFPKVHWSRTSEHQESTGSEYWNGGNKIC